MDAPWAVSKEEEKSIALEYLASLPSKPPSPSLSGYKRRRPSEGGSETAASAAATRTRDKERSNEIGLAGNKNEFPSGTSIDKIDKDDGLLFLHEDDGSEEEEGGSYHSSSSPTPSRFEGAMFAHVTSMPYRAPELVMGCRQHGESVDSWGAGVCIAEAMRCGVQLALATSESQIQPVILTSTPLFASYAEGELGLLTGIGRLLGPPSRNVWKGARSLPGYMGVGGVCKWCRYGGGGGGGGEKAAAAVPLQPPPWCNSSTIASSCIGGGGGGEEKEEGKRNDGEAADDWNQPSLFHMTAVENIWDWLLSQGSATSRSGVLPSQDSQTPHALPLPTSTLLQERLALTVDLLVRLFAWDPSRRLTPAEALLHPLFTLSSLPGAEGRDQDREYLVHLTRELREPQKILKGEEISVGKERRKMEQKEEEEEEELLGAISPFFRHASVGIAAKLF